MGNEPLPLVSEWSAVVKGRRKAAVTRKRCDRELSSTNGGECAGRRKVLRLDPLFALRAQGRLNEFAPGSTACASLPRTIHSPPRGTSYSPSRRLCHPSVRGSESEMSDIVDFGKKVTGNIAYNCGLLRSMVQVSTDIR